MSGQEIKMKMKMENVYQWQIAKNIGVSEYTLCRWLRDDQLPAERLERILQAIQKAKNGEKE